VSRDDAGKTKPLDGSRQSFAAIVTALRLIAGEVIEAVSGQTWEDFISERILKKVGMMDSKPRHSDANGAANGGNIATPHAEIDGKVQPVKPFDSDNTNPAGGINSSAADITG
jgi:CubicO group peptidase (beta-lactamase class C family)